MEIQKHHLKMLQTFKTQPQKSAKKKPSSLLGLRRINLNVKNVNTSAKKINFMETKHLVHECKKNNKNPAHGRQSIS